MTKYIFLSSLLLGLVCGAQSAPATAPVAAPKLASPTAAIDAKLVEKAFKEIKFAYIIFGLIKNELRQRKFTDQKANELSAKIYWEIMGEYAVAYTKENLTSDDLNCVVQAYQMPEAAPFTKIIAPTAYIQEFKDTVLNKKTWTIAPNAPTEKQIESIVTTTGLAQQIIANIVNTLRENNLKSTKETVGPVYKKIMTMFQSLAQQNGSTDKTLQKFADQLDKPGCQKFFKFNIQYSNKRKLNLITDRIPK